MANPTKGIDDLQTESSDEVAEKPGPPSPLELQEEIGPPVAPRITKRGTSRAKAKMDGAEKEVSPRQRSPRTKAQTSGKSTTRRPAQPKKRPATKATGERPTQAKKPAAAKPTRQRASTTKGKTTTRRPPAKKKPAPETVVEANALAPEVVEAPAPATVEPPAPEITAQPPTTSKRVASVTLRPGFVLAGAAAVLLLAAIVAFALSGTGQDLPATGAASIVPSDALAYINLSIDSSRPAVRQEMALIKRFPSYPLASAAVLTRLTEIVGGGNAADFASGVKPWLGNEVAVAFLNTTSSAAGSLILLDVSDQSRARAFLKKSGATPNGTYRGVQLLRYRTGTELAFVGHYLALGQGASVRGAIDVAAGAAPSLEKNPAYVRASSTEPADRVLDAYASAAGVQRILVSRGGLLGALGVLLYQPALDGTAISVMPVSGGVQVLIHSALSPALKRLGGGPTPPFRPTLQADAPTGAALFLDTDGLDNAAPQVFKAAAAAGIAGRIGPLLQRLGDALAAEGVSPRSLVSIFSGETAVAVLPGGPGASASSRPPAVIIIARTNDEAQTRATLASMEVPLAQLFAAPASGPGQAPVFNDVQVGGVTAHELSLTPGLQLDYAVFDGRVVVSTSRDGIAAVVSHRRAIAADPEFRTTLATRPQRVSSLLFLDLSQLLSLGEQTGLTPSGRFRALTPDLERVRGVGMDSSSGEADTTAELYLQIP
jgi:hypothetical protein